MYEGKPIPISKEISFIKNKIFNKNPSILIPKIGNITDMVINTAPRKRAINEQQFIKLKQFLVQSPQQRIY